MYWRAESYFDRTSWTFVSRSSMASRFFLREAAADSRLRTRRASFLQAFSSSFVIETPGSYRDCFLIPVMWGFFLRSDSNISVGVAFVDDEDESDPTTDEEDETVNGSASEATRGRLLLLTSSVDSSSDDVVETVRCRLRMAILCLRASAASLVVVAVAISKSAAKVLLLVMSSYVFAVR